MLNRLDSSKWNIETFKEDLDYMDDEQTGPFVSGVFPVPKYDLIGKGSFGYFGQKGYFKLIFVCLFILGGISKNY